MASPFDIEEIYPDDGGRPLRLPRRQVGNSPQGVTVTLLADYTLRTRAALPSAAIVALLAESGVSAAGARTAISRLARRGVLEGSRQGRRSSYRLSRAAAANLSAGGNWILAATGTAVPWDGCWTLVAFSLPQDRAAQRRALRGQLRWLGYAPLYDGLWISPHELTPPARAQLAQLSPGAVTVFRGRHTELDALGHRAPVDAWDIAGIARHYQAFLRRWRRLLPRVTSGRVVGAAAVRTRTEVMDTFRRFPLLDPQLPAELLPAGWPRRSARELFAAIYDGLAEPAERHVRAVVARFADGVQPTIRAHTTADMLAGVAGDEGGADDPPPVCGP
ncbi:MULTISPECIES: PaaX family transcriptional regulator C-terminal domain-containing protein [Micromonospora]|uniref:PaaX family transcriptional regulator n=1 Tax=Micromonospora solifontis TaxID=2487138 RepID=A0ABX9WCD8_9ACTN|nr:MULTISPECIES: PaaX family transcriptional regulator C-terminal domain-containing protein [Micromonospora]NES16302.1 PaaX family transcriptional regulator [Micromonospora sp. PPF5-17B]NES38362.1 PaaX family transcriptional regulator [Micromonospora solifontis]NES58114.1 PaaX family transcriptional regulator [Micromonospora sp. PPF5-6]RNL95892.1 PaaX family transcriptional regulator [Micromonospora solifontis]